MKMMIRRPIFADRAIYYWCTEFASWLVIIAAVLVLYFMSTSCGTTANLFGLESVSAANDRQEEIVAYADKVAEERQEQTHEAIAQSFQPLETFFPGLVNGVRASLADAPYVPPIKPEFPDEEGSFPPWAQSLAEVGAATALAYLGVNKVRDSRRKRRGEAIDEKEAYLKGYYEDGKKA